jgi:hypothetical protein
MGGRLAGSVQSAPNRWRAFFEREVGADDELEAPQRNSDTRTGVPGARFM